MPESKRKMKHLIIRIMGMGEEPSPCYHLPEGDVVMQKNFRLTAVFRLIAGCGGAAEATLDDAPREISGVRVLVSC